MIGICTFGSFHFFAIWCFSFLFFEPEAETGFLNEMPITPTADIAPNIVIDVNLSIGTIVLAGCPLADNPLLRTICKLNPASSRKTQFFSKSISLSSRNC
ncbi:hypothetical protein K501DRAFT_79925 [Backusella circina FSU 941]|nr:hypothetical protein K501DRAFT_79925 [Backusella circina FSU 941]